MTSQTLDIPSILYQLRHLPRLSDPHDRLVQVAGDLERQQHDGRIEITHNGFESAERLEGEITL